MSQRRSTAGGSRKQCVRSSAVALLSFTEYCWLLPKLVRLRYQPRARRLGAPQGTACTMAAAATTRAFVASSSPTASEQQEPAGLVPRRSPPAVAAAGDCLDAAVCITIADLPDEVLGLIFSQLVYSTDYLCVDCQGCARPPVLPWPAACLPAHRLCFCCPPPCSRTQCISVTQVCKRWRHLFYSNHCAKLWGCMEYAFAEGEPHDPAANEGCLQFCKLTSIFRESAAFEVQETVPACRYAAQELPGYLAAHIPARLTYLRTTGVPLTAAALHALGQLRHLRELSIVPSQLVCSSKGLAAAVGQLEQLRRIECINSTVHRSLVAALSRLPRLEHAYLHSRGAALPKLSPLAALASSLTGLALIGEVGLSETRGLNLELATALPKLQRIAFGAPTLQVRCPCLPRRQLSGLLPVVSGSAWHVSLFSTMHCDNMC